MKLSDLACPDCGQQDYWLYDGANIREREFEGVYFVLTEDAAGKVAAAPAKDDEDYMDDFNVPKIMKEVVEHVQDSLDGKDSFSSVYCPQCKEPLE